MPSLFGQLLDDMPGQMLFDFIVAGYGLADLCLRILIPIMTPAMPDENRPEFFNFSDKITPLHANSSSAW